MGRSIPDHIIDQIRQSTDIVDLINSYLPLKRFGATWKACCPFHQEKTPSFVVNPQRQIFHCFGCGKGGNVFTFVMEKEGVDFPNAAHILARRLGVIVPEDDEWKKNRKFSQSSSPQEQTLSRTDERERLYLINEKFTEWFERNLKGNPDSPVAKYFATRGIPEEFASRFHIGAAPDSWDSASIWGKRQGFTEEELFSCGILTENAEKPGRFYDRFRNRLVFPIWNEQGRVVGFSARTVEKEAPGAKYVNSPETPLFKKSKVLYGLHLARKAIQEKGSAILCEGQIDVIAMHRAGFENAVAPQGTAFTEEQARILKRYTDNICLCFDSDSAGIKAAVRSLEIALPVGFGIKVVSFPSGKDPDELLKTSGSEAISEMIDSAMDFFDFLMKIFTAAHDASTPAGKSAIVENILKYIMMLESSVMRWDYASMLANSLGLPPETVFGELNRLRKEQNSRNQFRKTEQQKTDTPQPHIVASPEDALYLKAEKMLLELAVFHGSIARRRIEELPPDMISSRPAVKALETVILYTTNGEWELAAAHLVEMSEIAADPEISEMLVKAESSIPANRIDKAANDCIRTVRVCCLKKEIASIMNSMRFESSEEKRMQLMTDFQNKNKELNALQRGAASPLQSVQPRVAKENPVPAAKPSAPSAEDYNEDIITGNEYNE